jgi:hypothetical protein
VANRVPQSGSTLLIDWNFKDFIHEVVGVLGFMVFIMDDKLDLKWGS